MEAEETARPPARLRPGSGLLRRLRRVDEVDQADAPVLEPEGDPREAAIVRACRADHPDRAPQRRPLPGVGRELAVGKGPGGEANAASAAPRPGDDDRRPFLRLGRGRRLGLQREQEKKRIEHERSTVAQPSTRRVAASRGDDKGDG